MKKYVKILSIVMALILIVLSSSGCSNSDKEFDLWYENYENVSNTIKELRNTDYYEKSDDEQKVKLMKDCLEQLQDEGKISNLNYSDYMFSYDFPNYSFGYVVIRDTHEDCWRGISSLSQRNNTLKYNVVDDFFNIFKKENWKFIFGDDTDNNVTYDEIESFVKEYSNNDTNIELVTDTTVSTYTNLESKDLIYISAHGVYDENNDISIIWTQEKVTNQYKKNKVYKNLWENNDIGIGSNSKSEDCFVIKPSLFQDYYADNELRGSIVLLGVCEAFGKNNNENYDFYNSLQNAGASTVIGFCNSVNQGYSVLFYNNILNNYLSGQTIGESFSSAKDTVGNNQNGYFEIYTDFKADEFSAYPILKGDTEKKYKFADSINYGECNFTVKDSVSKENIANASIIVVNKSESFSSHCYKTDENGFCHIQLPTGKYNCVVQRESYQTEEFEIIIDSNVTNELLDPVLLKPKQNNMTNFFGMTFDEITKMFGTNYELYFSESSMNKMIVAYKEEENIIPFSFTFDINDEAIALEKPNSDSTVSEVRYSNSDKKTIYYVSPNISTDIVYSDLTNLKDGILWQDSLTYVFTYKVNDISIDFEYYDKPTDNSIADFIYISKRDWNPSEEQLGISTNDEIYANNILTVTGKLKKENYEINSNNKGTVMILDLDSPIKYKFYDDFLGYNGEEHLITSVQVSVSNEEYENYKNESIVMSGNVVFGHNGHHLREIVLVDCKIEQKFSNHDYNAFDNIRGDPITDFDFD